MQECRQATMLRTRMVAFATGFAVAGAAIAHFVWKDLWTDSLSLSSNVKHQFGDLEARVSDLESSSKRVENKS